MIYVVGFAALAIIFWIWSLNDRAGKYKTRETTVYESLNHEPYKLFINYNVSAIHEFGLRKIIALSVTLVSKADEPITRIRIEADPVHKVAREADLRAYYQNFIDEHYSLTSHLYKQFPAEVQPRDIVSGYLFFETASNFCDISALVVRTDAVQQTIAVRGLAIHPVTEQRLVA